MFFSINEKLDIIINQNVPLSYKTGWQASKVNNLDDF